MTRFLVLWLALGIGVSLADTPAASPWRASIESRVAKSCGTAIAPAGIDDLIGARLRDVGIPVSPLFNSQFSVEVDCVPVTDAGAPSLAMHQCLDFSELVPAPSNDGRPTLASTWRRCATNTCARGKCDADARSTVEAQFVGLSAVLQDRLAARVPAPSAPSQAFSGIEVSRRAAVTFYSVYIMACLTLVVYWKIRKQAY